MEYKICEKCGKRKADTEFFKKKDGIRIDMCKKCLTENIDNSKPDTFKWILKMFDVPYVEKKWIELSNKILEKQGPEKFGPNSVIGQYIRTMNMVQYHDLTWDDTDRINYENKVKEEEAKARQELQRQNQEFENKLKSQLESGEISQAEYDTRSMTTFKPEEGLTFVEIKGNFDAEDRILSELTDEDRTYLITKWGAHYKPSEWLTMENMYNNYSNEYELNIDREETLKKICKVSLKLDMAIDSGDVTAAKSYGTLLDTLRKSAKFTEAQNKEEVAKELDSIGELIAICERDGGIIEQFSVDPDDYPQDKIDLTIKDLKQYNHDLVVNELGLGDLIESYIQKLDEAAQRDQEEFEKMFDTNPVDEEVEALTDKEAQDFLEYLDHEIEADAEMLLESLGENHAIE